MIESLKILARKWSYLWRLRGTERNVRETCQQRRTRIYRQERTCVDKRHYQGNVKWSGSVCGK